MAPERCRDVAHVSAVQLRTHPPAGRRPTLKNQAAPFPGHHGTPPILHRPVLEVPG